MYLVDFICPRFGVHSAALAEGERRPGRAQASCFRVIHAVCHVTGRNETCLSGLIKDSSNSRDKASLILPGESKIGGGTLLQAPVLGFAKGVALQQEEVSSSMEEQQNIR